MVMARLLRLECYSEQKAEKIRNQLRPFCSQLIAHREKVIASVPSVRLILGLCTDLSFSPPEGLSTDEA